MNVVLSANAPALKASTPTATSTSRTPTRSLTRTPSPFAMRPRGWLRAGQPRGAHPKSTRSHDQTTTRSGGRLPPLAAACTKAAGSGLDSLWRAYVGSGGGSSPLASVRWVQATSCQAAVLEADAPVSADRLESHRAVQTHAGVVGQRHAGDGDAEAAIDQPRRTAPRRASGRPRCVGDRARGTRWFRTPTCRRPAGGSASRRRSPRRVLALRERPKRMCEMQPRCGRPSRCMTAARSRR